MIEIRDLEKSFGEIRALQHISLTIRDGELFGVVGTNGAGKSTLLRILAGVLRQEKGTVLVDGEPVFENEKIKSRICFLPDDLWFFHNAAPADMEDLYQNLYAAFDRKKFRQLCSRFGLDRKRKLRTFSKGMQKQTAIFLGICANTEYLLCDETFDGLDPVMRQAVKSLFASEIMNREFTPVIASHNLRELEDICDHIGLLHKGGILLSRDLEDMKFHIHKVQCVLSDKKKEKELEKELEVLKIQRQGSLLLITARGTRLEILERIQSKNPLFCEVIPLTLEEIFICETEVAGYEIKNIFF